MHNFLATCKFSCPGRGYPARATMQPIPETARVLIGVFSFGNSKAARERMRGVRELSDLRHPQLVQRFVSPADEVAEPNATDILRFDITRDQRLKLGKYLLQNAFLAFASRLEHLLWVVRADDDVIANASAVTARLLAYSRRDEPYMVYGQFKWYQWHVPTASAACIAASWWGHKSLPAVVNFTANCKPEWPPCDATNVAAPDPTAGPNGGCAPGLCPRLRPHMCHLPDNRGPFLFANGPFAGFSAPTLRLLASVIRRRNDEPSFLGRAQHRLYSVLRGRVFDPGHRFHPSRVGLYEDVYLGWLMWEELRDKRVVLVGIQRFLEYGHPAFPRLAPPAGATIHGLKAEDRGWSYVRAHRETLLQPAPLDRRYPTLERWAVRSCRGERCCGDAVQCCQRWVLCDGDSALVDA